MRDTTKTLLERRRSKAIAAQRRPDYNRDMNVAVVEDTIDRAGRALISAASAPAKVILFGSRARGDATDRSDFDFLVVERDVADRFAETARLGQVLGRLLIPADVVVISERYAEKWAPVQGTLVHEAMSQGRIVAES